MKHIKSKLKNTTYAVTNNCGSIFMSDGYVSGDIHAQNLIPLLQALCTMLNVTTEDEWRTHPLVIRHIQRQQQKPNSPWQLVQITPLPTVVGTTEIKLWQFVYTRTSTHIQKLHPTPFEYDVRTA